MKKSFIFTNKQHSKLGIMSTVLGAMTLCSNLFSIIHSYRLAGGVPTRYGSALFLTAVMAGIGLLLGIISRTRVNKFYLFGYIGIALNAFSLILTSGILYAGAYL